MLMYRSLVSVLAIILFGILIKLPDAVLDNYGIDRDVLLACAIATLCLPWLHKMANN